MKVAIPRFGDDIAPWFDVASHFVIYTIEKDQSILSEVFICSGSSGMNRVQKLQEYKVDILICGSISNKYKHLLQTHGVTVINQVTGPAENAIEAFLHGELCGAEVEPVFQLTAEHAYHHDLVQRAYEIFSGNGYKVSGGADVAPFPIDLIAEAPCPVCKKNVRLAICCGMHTYRADEEVREFHYVAGDAFNAMIYLHEVTPELEKACSDFGIFLLDPERLTVRQDTDAEETDLPLVKLPLNGHQECALIIK